MTKEIQLTQGKVALVSDHRWEYLSQFKWYAVKRGKTFYAERMIRNGLGRKKIHMHREILSTPEHLDVDHIDRNGLNNTDENIRNCSRSENVCNTRATSSNTSGYKGVSLYKPDNKWRSEIMKDRKSFFLGYFDDPESAARAYDEAAKRLHGKFARLNFE